jgi:hypothetical protein
MAGEAQKVQSYFFPAPTGGLNYVDNPAFMPITEARALQNYLVFPWGIQQRSKEEAHISNTYANASIYPYWKDGVEKMIIYKSGQLYKLDNETDTTPTSLAITTRTASAPQACYFNKRIFFFNKKEVPVVYTISSETAADSSFTGPTSGGTALGYGFSYKSRMYMIEQNANVTGATPTNVWYTDVDAVSGALTSIDFGSILANYGSLVAGFSWSVNQGIASEELFCLLADNGEMLIYSGDSPEAPNWQLIARIQVPVPLENDRITKIGQETYINTVRGVLPMSQIFASRVGNATEQASLSRKLGEVNLGKSCVSRWSPFAFFTGSNGVYALNYENGSWSYLKFSSAVTDVGCCGPNLFISNTNGVLKVVLPRGSHYLNGNGENAGTDVTRCVWKTPFLDLGTQANKSIKRVKVVGADISVGASFKNTAWIKANQEDDSTDTTAASSGTDSATTTTNDNSVNYMLKRLYTQELRPPGTGNRLSVCFNKVPSGEINEIHGIEIMHEVGGLQ